MNRQESRQKHLASDSACEEERKQTRKHRTKQETRNNWHTSVSDRQDFIEKFVFSAQNREIPSSILRNPFPNPSNHTLRRLERRKRPETRGKHDETTTTQSTTTSPLRNRNLRAQTRAHLAREFLVRVRRAQKFRHTSPRDIIASATFLFSFSCFFRLFSFLISSTGFRRRSEG